MPVFHEDWYNYEQLKVLQKISRDCKYPNDQFTEYKNLEIGCWEGKSTIEIANSIYPEELICVDTWKGNIDEGEKWSQIFAQERDVHSQFLDNMIECTKSNFRVFEIDCHEFLRNTEHIFKFVHIDACHDYLSVKRTIEALIPKLINGGILCGDDYLTANDKREDLNGGVMRAVKELLPNHYNIGNLWIWKKE